jgi:prolyl oligopeptidase
MRKFIWVILAGACATPQESVAVVEVKDSTEIKVESMQNLEAKVTVEVTQTALPKTRVQDLKETLHGVVVDDRFRWLEDEKSTAVKQWMESQNDFARSQLRALGQRDTLKKRYTELYYLESISAPIKRGNRYFYTRTRKDKEKSFVVFKEGSGGIEKVLLDPNEWSKDNTVSLGTWAPSWDGKKVVFAEKPNAADEATLHVIDVDTLKRSEIDVIEGAKYASPSWLSDSSGFLYEWLPTDSKIPTSERPGYCEVRMHTLGTDPTKDEVIHEKTGDAKTFIGGDASRDGKFLFISITRGWNENDVYFKRVGKDKTWQLLIAGKDARYGVNVWKGSFYIFTDEGAPNKRVFKVDPNKFERKNWKEIIKEDKQSARESVLIVGGHIAISSLRKAVSAVELFTLDGKKVREVQLPGLGTASNLLGLEDDDEAFYSFSSFVSPSQTFKTSVKTGVSELYAKVEVPVDASKFEVKQVNYPSKDGTMISMFIVAKKDLKLDGNNPTLLYGYGGFDIAVRSAFSSFIYPWIEAGGVYASPNLRGGGEYGKAWHDAGKLALKQNVFDDFAGAAEYLIKEKYTKASKIGIRGGSNGGLLTGTLMTQRPELFGAVICAVPLLDMVRYHLYGSGKTWIPEYGDPEKPEDLKVLAAYSPYHHVKEGTKYPPLLMMSADHDDRVDPFHARKFVARVQQVSPTTDSWLRIEAHAGHGGSDQVGKTIESSVDQIAFLFDKLGVAMPTE